jgi:hypothetical protein
MDQIYIYIFFYILKNSGWATDSLPRHLADLSKHTTTLSGRGCMDQESGARVGTSSEEGRDGNGEGEDHHEDSSLKGEGNGSAAGTGQKLTKEQLIDYVKKQRVKIKQLENKIQEMQSEAKGSQAPSSGSPSENPQGMRELL